MSSDYPINVKDASNPQQFGSALSYARRYGLQSVLLLNAADDDGSTAAAATNAGPAVLDVTSTVWKSKVEPYVIKEIGAGKSADEIMKSIATKYKLSDAVKQFINDNATPEAK